MHAQNLIISFNLVFKLVCLSLKTVGVWNFGVQIKKNFFMYAKNSSKTKIHTCWMEICQNQ